MDTLFTDALWTECPDEEPNELRQCLHYSSTSGKLYIATDDGKIRCTEIRQQLLSGEWSENRADASSIPPSITTLQPFPEIDLTITSFAINKSGSHAIVCGPTLSDPEITFVAILDLAARRRTSHALATIPSTRLDGDLFSTHPGLRVLHLKWHPDSDIHVAILTSDSTWRLYEISQPHLAEQTFELSSITGRRGLVRLPSRLSPSPSPGSGGGGDSERQGTTPFQGAVQYNNSSTGDIDTMFDPVINFCFGSNTGWNRFSVYFLSKKGRIYVLCPVAPFHARYPSRIIHSLRKDVELSLLDYEVGQTAEAWLQRAFVPVSTLFAPATTAGDTESSIGIPDLEVCCPHALDDHSPVLVGPLPTVSADSNSLLTHSLTPSSSPAAALQAGIQELNASTESMVIWSIAGDACSVLAVATDSGTVLVHLVAGCPTPRWHAAVPQCVLDSEELRAVRMQCGGAEANARASQGAAGDVAGSNEMRLLLLDIIEVPRSNVGGGNLSNNSGMFSRTTAITPSATADDGVDDELDYGQTPGSRSAVLEIDHASDDVIYYILPRCAFSISLPWIAHLANGIAALVHKDAPLQDTLPDVLPPPTVTTLCTCAEGPSIVAGVAVGDALCGAGVVLLLSNNAHRCVHPVRRPRIEVDAVGDSKEASKEIASGNDDVQVMVDRVYKEVLQGPSSAKENNKGGSVGDGGDASQVQRVLVDATSRLRASHIEYIHKAHHVLAERLEQARDEVVFQEERAQRISALVEKAQTANGHLENGVHKAQWMSENLSRRLHLLAELHWALPKPESLAESSFRKQELPILEETARKLDSSLVTVGSRIAALKDKQGHGYQQAAGSDVPIPPQQLRKIRELLSEHERAIRMARQQADALENAMSGF